MKTSFAPLSLVLLAAACNGEPMVDHSGNEEASLMSSLFPKILQGPNNGAFSQTQTQKTLICPEVAQDLYEGHLQYGPRTRFVLKNTATDPVVVTFVHRNGTEYSAANAHVQPAQMDPDAILVPGVTKVFAVHEGHVFHVRDAATGELLMQHRAGLVPVENRFNREIVSCPQAVSKDTIGDMDSFRVMRKFPHWQPMQIDESDQDIYIDVGFKNTIKSQSGTPCPVNFYFVQKQESGSRRPPKFLERFSLQLGVNHLATADEHAWDANTKYERTFLGHEFVARLAHDDSVVVDYLSVGPIKAQDCTPKKKSAVKTRVPANAIVIPVGKHTKLADDTNNTEWETGFHQLNTTESRRGLYFQMHSE